MSGVQQWAPVVPNPTTILAQVPGNVTYFTMIDLANVFSVYRLKFFPVLVCFYFKDKEIHLVSTAPRLCRVTNCVLCRLQKKLEQFLNFSKD